MVDWTELTLFIFIIARMSGFVLFNPILSRTGLPTTFRAGLILVLSISVLSAVPAPPEVPSSVLVMMIQIILEMALGFLVGMVMQFFFYVPQLAGDIIDMQMGLSMNQAYDPGSQANMTVTGRLINTLMILLFFVENGHHTLLRILITSGDIIPYGSAAISNGAASAALELFLECTVFAVKMSLPILAAELVGQIGMGVLMKVIPQINVFAINIDLKVLIGLVLVIMLMAPFSEYLLQMEVHMLNSIGEIITITSQ